MKTFSFFCAHGVVNMEATKINATKPPPPTTITYSVQSHKVRFGRVVYAVHTAASE